jgi:hypothetical protein
VGEDVIDGLVDLTFVGWNDGRIMGASEGFDVGMYDGIPVGRAELWTVGENEDVGIKVGLFGPEGDVDGLATAFEEGSSDVCKAR